MKKFTGGRIIQKISLAFIIIVLLFQFMMPIKSEAVDLFGTEFELPKVTDIFKYMSQIISGTGDLVMSAFNNWFLGTKGYGTAMIDSETLEKGSWFDNDGVVDSYNSVNFDNDTVVIGEDKDSKKIVIYVKDGSIENSILAGSENWEVPNLLYCPENIFGNNIAMLDVNFLNPNEYEQVLESQKGENATNAKKSIAGQLKTTIVSWYRSLRNLAVVALLSILVYLGIRILLSSTAEDKAKYKQTIKDWAIALCLVFIMHFIMSGIIMIVNQINTLFENVNSSIYVNYGGTIFQTNFTGAIRFLAQSSTAGNAWVYTVIYWVLICYTFIFTVQYLRRVLFIAFYTMISPLVAITYPIDKLGDGKSQAFNKWFKEYVMTMVLQPIHLIIYSMIVSSALSLSLENPLYALVAIGFLIPAEKFIRGLFGVESKADAGFGSFAGGALTMQALNALKKSKGGSNLKGGKGGHAGDGEEDSKIRSANNKELEHWKNSTEDLNEAEKSKSIRDRINALSGNIAPVKSNEDVMQNKNQTEDLNEAEKSKSFRDRINALSGNIAPVKSNEDIMQNKAQTDDSDDREKAAKEKYNNIRYKRRDQWERRQALRLGKGLGKGAKYIAKGIGAATLGSVGLAAGIASGKGIDGAWKGAAAGAAAGVAVTNRLGNGSKKAIKGVDNSIQRFRENKLRDYKAAGRDEKAKEYMDKINSTPRNKINRYAKYNGMVNEYAMKKGERYNMKEQAELRKRMADYADNYGVTDKDKIFKGIDMEKQYQDKFGDKTHEKIADIMQLTNTYGRQYITDKKKYEEFNNNLEAHGITGKAKEDIIELFHVANDAKYDRPTRQKGK